jgi:glycosyltransferase involved in cell wall biosynthesis
VNFDLSQGLLKRGHKVVIFASDDSQVPRGGHLVKMGKAKGTVNTDWVKVERDAYNIYDHSLDEFDIVHSSDWFGFPYLSKKRNPEIKVCHTHHGGLADNWWKRSPPPFKLNLIAISKWMQQVYQKQGFPSQVAYNPIDTDFYEFQEAKGERYLFLGRIDPIKGVHTAILIAQQAKVELDVVGGTSFVSDVQYVEQIKAMCDESQINFIGEVSQEEKL